MKNFILITSNNLFHFQLLFKNFVSYGKVNKDGWTEVMLELLDSLRFTFQEKICDPTNSV